VLGKRDRRKIGLVVLIQIVMGGIDLLAIGLISILGSLAVTGISSRQPGNRVYEVLKFLNLEGSTFQRQAAILATAATVLLIARTALSVFFTRKIMFFLSRRGAAISADLVRKLLSQTLLFVQGKTSQHTLYALTSGVSSITLGIIGTAVAIVSDFSLLLILMTGVFIINAQIAIGMVIAFGLIGFSLYKLMHGRAKLLGQQQADLEIKSNEKIIEVLGSYREAIVRNRRSYYANQIGELRFKLADTQAELAFMPNISKYVIESTVVLGALAISAVQFIMQDAGHAVATLAVLLASGTRIAPAALRLQQGSVQIRSTIGVATPTLDLIESLNGDYPVETDSPELKFVHEGFVGSIIVEDVNFSYPGRNSPAINEVSFEVNAGQTLALVGSSGAGKTTVVDTLLGVLVPDSGKVTISKLSPLDAAARWPGAISYVPQDVMIVNGSIRENIALGYPIELASDERVMAALKLAHLDEFISELPSGIDTYVGERGAKLSGGQRQRLGIARALFSKPKLLVLDEATSALDGNTEALIAKSISELASDVTVIIIAHRLSTIKSVDKIAYLESGRIKKIGTFEEIRRDIPDFNNQANLMGL
jgi:ABC-type multidrug transport system fused ATPase/permease subunit